MKRNQILVSVLLVLGVPAIAYAHSLAIYASTPVTPPRGWLWVPIVFVIGTILLDYVALGRAVSLPKLIVRDLLCLFIFFIVFFAIGSCSAMMTTGPMPGLGPPHTAFYGMSVLGGGMVFLVFNALGLYIFLYSRRLLCATLKITEREIRRRLFGAGVVVYLLVLIPYVFASAMAHGWPGGHITMQCRMRVETIGAGLVGYAQEHGGALPRAETMEEVIAAVGPYLPEERSRWLDPLDTCPIEDVYEREPRPYVWNADFSGARLDISEEYDENTPMIRCPAGHFIGESPALHYYDLFRLEAFEHKDEEL